jgi:TonB family protein
MKHEDSDKEIASLYQQRKQQVNAPDIDFSSLKKNKKPLYTIVQLLGILFFGSAASFGILAVISHFSTQVPKPAEHFSPTKLSVVELDQEQITPVDEVIAIVIPALVPKKPYVAPVYSKSAQVHGMTELPNALPFSLFVDVITVSINPKVKQPALSLVPIYQEQPKYSHKAIRTQQSGTVKLAYVISPEGSVTNITTVESSANRELNFAARKALSRWRYRAGEYREEGYEIIFDFTLEKNK